MVTAVVSIVVALVLFNLTKLSGRARITADKKKQEYLASSILSDESMRHTIFEEINEIVDSQPSRQEAIKKISDVFSRELEKRINLNTQELSKKYEAIIKGEKQNEEIAWKKYKRVLSDKEKTEAVIRSIAEGLVVVDAQGKVIMMNPAAEKLLGVSRKDKIGKALLENLKEEQLISLVKGADDKEEREIELVSQRDETKKVLRASSAVIENENGQTIGMVSVLSDITKQKELDKLKNSFVANVSHELRTPLVAIDKSLSLILNKSTGEISPTQEEFLSIAQRNLKRLSLLVNDLLDLSKLEAGKMEFKRQPSSIEKIIDESIEGLNTWAKTKSIEIVKKIQGDLPQVNIDSNRIIQVLNNLIGNAIKFTPNNGNITVEASFQSEKEEVKISVQDTGIGIPKENLPQIFDKFFQVTERVPTDISGTGIGLSIAKEIVELHGGRIWAESEEGQGAKFIFTLPLK
jgi:NtrC-family two-component system sensor histidine kinase KinB